MSPGLPSFFTDLTPSILSTLVCVRFYFYKDIYSQDDVLPPIACWLVLQYSCCRWPKWERSNIRQINMDLRRHLIVKTVIFASVILNLWPLSDETLPASSSSALSVRVRTMWCNRKEKQRVEELEGGVYLRAVHDIFFTLRLLSCTAVNMMDNVLGLGLMGVIWCLYHQLWRAETERERGNERNWQRAADSESRTSPHYSQILLGVDQTGAIWSLNFKEFHCLFLELSLCTSIGKKRKKTETHTHTFSQHTHTLVPYLWPVGTHYLPRRAVPWVAGLVSCRRVTLWRQVQVHGLWGRETRERRTHGGLGLWGHQMVCLWRFGWFICSKMLILILENNVTGWGLTCSRSDAVIVIKSWMATS